MSAFSQIDLGPLKDKLERLPFALTIADDSAPDHPLIYSNSAFTDMTGYGPEKMGYNCRFLQEDLPNFAARAEVRDALSQRRKTQVMLHNQRANGEKFYNLLLLYPLPATATMPKLTVGSQFDLGPVNPETIRDPDEVTYEDRLARLRRHADQTRLERRRLVTEAAVRLIQSWYVIKDTDLDL